MNEIASFILENGETGYIVTVNFLLVLVCVLFFFNLPLFIKRLQLIENDKGSVQQELY